MNEYLNQSMKPSLKSNKSMISDCIKSDVIFNSRNKYPDLHTHSRSLAGSSTIMKDYLQKEKSEYSSSLRKRLDQSYSGILDSGLTSKSNRNQYSFPSHQVKSTLANSSMIDHAYDNENKIEKSRRSSSKRKTTLAFKKCHLLKRHTKKLHFFNAKIKITKKKHSKDKTCLKSSSIYPITTYREVSLPKNKKNIEEQNEICYFKDRTHSLELRTSQDSYKRLNKKNLRPNISSTDLPNQHTLKTDSDNSVCNIGAAKQNNYMCLATNNENDQRQSNVKILQPTAYQNSAIAIQNSESEVILNLKAENKKLMQLLEKTEKSCISRLKESKNQTDKIMSIINKVWKVMQKQIIDRSQRKTYFEKNSPEETELKRLLKENEDIRTRRESKIKLLENIDNIFDLCFTKLVLKQETDRKICENEHFLKSRIKQLENEMSRFKSEVYDLNLKLSELESFKIMVLDNTVYQLAEQEELLIHLKDFKSTECK